jgi:DNA-binding NarL/FixJ family response regulator
MKKIRILIADDHSMVRQGVRTVIEQQPAWELCGEAENGRIALDLAKTLAPDVVVFDVSMPELNGMEAARILRSTTPEIKVLILTMHNSETLAHEVLQSGAHGYLLKSDAAELLPLAIETVVAGKVFMTPKLAYLANGPAPRSTPVENNKGFCRPRLTPRERSIVRVLAEGKSNKEAASVLGVSLGTIETHRKNIFGKLGIHCTADLVRYAIRNQLVEP